MHQEKGKTPKHWFEMECLLSDEDKPWNIRNSKQKAGISTGLLTAILERLDLFLESCFERKPSRLLTQRVDSLPFSFSGA